ncbi:hypothetical protein ACRAWF_39865 [Streptomyces sp. L7]
MAIAQQLGRTCGPHPAGTARNMGLRWRSRARDGGWQCCWWTWGLTRVVLLLFVFKVFVFPGPDVTSDVSVIYQGWYETLRHRQYPAGRRHLAVPARRRPPDLLSPALLGFLDYASAFFVLASPGRPGGPGPAPVHGPAPRPYTPPVPGCGWRGVPLLGPTVVRALRRDGDRGRRGRAARRCPAPTRWRARWWAFGALLKVWPALLLLGAVKRRGVGRGGWCTVADRRRCLRGVDGRARSGAS